MLSLAGLLGYTCRATGHLSALAEVYRLVPHTIAPYDKRPVPGNRAKTLLIARTAAVLKFNSLKEKLPKSLL